MKEILAVKEYEKDGEKKSIWIRIGSAFENRDGSMNLVFDAFPVNTQVKTIQVREAKPREDRQAAKSGKTTRFTDAELMPDEDVKF